MRRWSNSLYWRIAAGFIAFLAVMLLAQVAFFLWLSSQRDDALPPRILANLAALVADDLSAEAARSPSADLGDLARDRFADLARPAVLLFPDGRLVGSSTFVPPEPQIRATLRRLTAADGDAAWAPRRPGTRRGPGPPDDGFGPAGGRPGTGWVVAPVRVGERVAAALFVARGRPPGAVVRELAPWLGLGFAALLAIGTALAAVAIFRPAHVRLRHLEDAVRRFGDGDRTARAATTGGDEVSAVAHAFNRMADEAAMREAALIDADRARRQLLADVSHELRTPLTSIRGYAETLGLPAFAPTSPQGQQAVQVLAVEAQRLERIVNDLLDLARLDAGGAPLEIRTVPVQDLFTRVIERHGRDAAALSITLDADIAPGAEAVRGDRVRLEQVLQNLTANAIRHARPEGQVRLSAAREHGALVLRVTDDGEGIPAEHLPRVFERFYKADPARAGHTGTGLGLSIVKAIVERHGGTVAVSSTPGLATTFEVRLPAG
ncbi:MAG: ATP-binding protein [Vicinamibacterales bacterium]